MARRVIVMHNRSGGIAFLIILALILIILGITNPTKDDFSRFLASRARSQVGDKGIFTDLAKGIAGAGGELSSRAYYRHNFLIFSLFKYNGTDQAAFVGFGKYIFIKTGK